MTEDWIELRGENEKLIAACADKVKDSLRKRTMWVWIWSVLAIGNFGVLFIGSFTVVHLLICIGFTAFFLFNVKDHYNFWTSAARDWEKLQRDAHASRIEIDKIIRDLRGF